MKRKDLEKLAKKNGFRFVRHGGDHDAWMRGTELLMIPRHAEINEMLAKAIIKRHGLK